MLLAALVASALPISAAEAAPTCLKSDNQCDPDKLCTFKSQLADKVLIYQTLLRNSQVTKRAKGGKREGIPYDGLLYNEAVTEAIAGYPKLSHADQMVQANAIFQKKLRAYVNKTATSPSCSYDGKENKSLLPKPGYTGMETNDECKVKAQYEAGDYDAEGFGSSDKTSCVEFYDRDRAHEMIHAKRCEAAKKRNQPQTFNIDDGIEEELIAYRHTVKLSQAYVRLLSLQCSAMANPKELQKRAKQVQDLLTPYLKK